MLKQNQMAEKTLPPGMAWINMNGHIKYVAKHLAYDKQLQKSSKFYVCDENGVEISQPESETLPNVTEKKSVEVAEDEPTIQLPVNSPLINPLEEPASDNPQADSTETNIEAPVKRGRKPKIQ